MNLGLKKWKQFVRYNRKFVIIEFDMTGSLTVFESKWDL
jgi:hypothetical protein